MFKEVRMHISERQHMAIVEKQESEEKIVMDKTQNNISI